MSDEPPVFQLDPDVEQIVKENDDGSVEIGLIPHIDVPLVPEPMAVDVATFPPAQIDLIKRTVAVGCTDDELQLFLYTCSKTGLDPLTRQIFAIKRSGKLTIQVGIDGLRVVAQRSHGYAGNDDPEFDVEAVMEEHPNTAKVTVYRMVGELRVPFSATARWGEYCPADTRQAFMWQKMPFLMLGKCAEALALRKAFPAELSGLYTFDEMEQAATPTGHVTVGKAVFAGEGEQITPALETLAEITRPEVDDGDYTFGDGAKYAYTCTVCWQRFPEGSTNYYKRNPEGAKYKYDKHCAPCHVALQEGLEPPTRRDL